MPNHYQDPRNTDERLYANGVQYYQKAKKSDGTDVVYFFSGEFFRAYEGFDSLEEVADSWRELDHSGIFGTKEELEAYLAGK